MLTLRTGLDCRTARDSCSPAVSITVYFPPPAGSGRGWSSLRRMVDPQAPPLRTDLYACWLFERTLSEWISGHLSRIGPDLSEDQFGFQQAQSTGDDILRVRALLTQVLSRGEEPLATSLDNVNTFNYLPWWTAKEALDYHRVSQYLKPSQGGCMWCGARSGAPIATNHSSRTEDDGAVWPASS